MLHKSKKEEVLEIIIAEVDMDVAGPFSEAIANARGVTLAESLYAICIALEVLKAKELIENDIDKIVTFDEVFDYMKNKISKITTVLRIDIDGGNNEQAN